MAVNGDKSTKNQHKRRKINIEGKLKLQIKNNGMCRYVGQKMKAKCAGKTKREIKRKKTARRSQLSLYIREGCFVAA